MVGASLSVTDCAGCDWKMVPKLLATAVVAATAGRASVEAIEPSGRAVESTSSALTADDTLKVGTMCALAPLEPIASMKSPTPADEPRPPKSFTTDPLPF